MKHSLTTRVHALLVGGEVVLVAMAVEETEMFAVVGVPVVPEADGQEDKRTETVLDGKMADFSWREGGREGGREGVFYDLREQYFCSSYSLCFPTQYIYHFPGHVSKIVTHFNT